MRLAYITGPYSGENANEVHDNIEHARRVACRLWRRGYAVICPHMNTAFMEGVTDYEIFLAGYLEMVRRCDLVVALHTHARSEGATAEIMLAQDLGIPVVHEKDVSTLGIQMGDGG